MSHTKRQLRRILVTDGYVSAIAAAREDCDEAKGAASRRWYGSAQSAKHAPRHNNAQSALRRVGGMNDRSSTSAYLHGEKYTRGFDRVGARAVYGSTDRATVDHRNDPLCHVIEDDSALRTAQHYNGAVYRENVCRKADMQTVDSTPPSTEEILRLADRASARGMTICEFLIKTPYGRGWKRAHAELVI